MSTEVDCNADGARAAVGKREISDCEDKELLSGPSVTNLCLSCGPLLSSSIFVPLDKTSIII